MKRLLRLFLLLTLACSGAALQLAKRICRSCKKDFDPSDPKDVCRFHTGRFIGAERSKHYGKSGQEFRGFDYFWDCCDAESPSDPGCRTGLHCTYDEKDDAKFIMLNRKS